MNVIGYCYCMLLVSIILPAFSSAQSPKSRRDSLLQQLSTQTGDEKINTLFALVRTYWYVQNDSAIILAESAKQLAELTGSRNSKAEANRILGMSNLNAYKSINSIQPFLDQALFSFKELADKKGIADTYNNLGSLNTFINHKEKALAYYDSALINYRQLSDRKGEAAVLNYIGIIYQNLGEFRKAIDFTLQGLLVREKTDDYLGIVFSYLNVGNIFLAGGQPEIAIRYYQQGVEHGRNHSIPPPEMAFNMLGKSYLQLGNLEKAGQYLLPSRGNQNRDKILLGNLFFAMGQIDSAVFYYEEKKSIAEKYGDKQGQAEALTGLAKISLKRGDNTTAFDFAKKAHALASGSDIRILAESAGLLAQLYEAGNQSAMALHYMKEQHGILDSTVNSGYQQKLAYFESKAAMDKLETGMQTLSVQKQLQEKLYKQEKLLKNFLLAVSILILVTAFFVIRNISSKRNKIQKQNLLLDEQKNAVEKAYNDLQAAQAQLVQSAKMASLGELTAGIAHEIQNPLNFVNNFSDVNAELIDEMEKEMNMGNIEEAKGIARDIKVNEQKINHHGKRADSIVKGMLQHSRETSGQKESTDLNKLVDEYVRLSYHGLRAKDKSFSASLHTDYDESIGRVNVIPQDIGRVILNLINNAFYAVDEKKNSQLNGYDPIVSIATKKEGDMVLVIVKDNGNGVPQKALEKIFQPFFTTKPTGQGTGLGLSLSYDIVKTHGGDIKVTTREGEGTEFIVQLPI